MTAGRPPLFDGPPPMLGTGRLILRALVRDDAAAIARAIDHEDIARNTRTIPFPYTLDDAHGWLDICEQGYADGSLRNWGIIEASSGDLVGSVGMNATPDTPDAEAGYWITSTRWGRGYASEALAELVRHAFSLPTIDRLHAAHFVDNPASGRVLEKAGFRAIGERIQDRALGAERGLSVLMELTRGHAGG